MRAAAHSPGKSPLGKEPPGKPPRGKAPHELREPPRHGGVGYESLLSGGGGWNAVIHARKKREKWGP